MVTRKIKACDVWISSPNKIFFEFDLRMGFYFTHLKPVTPKNPTNGRYSRPSFHEQIKDRTF